jgi:hypothetical protein
LNLLTYRHYNTCPKTDQTNIFNISIFTSFQVLKKIQTGVIVLIGVLNSFIDFHNL